MGDSAWAVGAPQHWGGAPRDRLRPRLGRQKPPPE